MTLKNTETCRLCASPAAFFYKAGKESDNRSFFHCHNCDLVLVKEEELLTAEEEKSRYKLHENDPSDKQYRNFLNRLWKELRPLLPCGSTGLDYGAGPGPALAKMIEESGFSIHIYDPFFSPDKSKIERSYDFITCTETAEHFHHPFKEFQLLDKLLRPGGRLGIMTTFIEDKKEFADWWYHRDPTHVAFYSRNTFNWIADTFGWEAIFPAENVVIFRKMRGLLKSG